MTPRSDLPIELLKELLEAHVGPIREDIREMRNDSRIGMAAMRSDIGVIAKRAEEAHSRIDKHENRLTGWLAGIGLTGTGIGAALAKLFG